MATKIMHGRREGQEKANTFLPNVSMLTKNIKAREVAVLQPRDWQRIQNSLSRYNREAEKYQAQKRDREKLHATSKELVKHWGNTIEGQRLKKLQARKIREEQEEIERQKIDIEEAKLQAQQRKEAIERAKKLQYYETDRVKGFHGALLLTEVLKERDAQIDMKNAKQDWQKERNAKLYAQQEKNLAEAIRIEHEKEHQRYLRAKDVSDFQTLQVKDKDENLKQDKLDGIKEGQTIKQQFEAFEAAKEAIKAQNRKYKKVLMDTYKREIVLKKEREEQEKIEEKLEEEEIKKFVNAKRKMASMRKAKEQELFEAFQNHTEKMRQKLHTEMKQKVDDEDERIAKTVAERERKRLEEEERKQKQQREALDQMNQHRLDMIGDAEKLAHENKKKDRALLHQRIESDKEFHRSVLEDKIQQRDRLSSLQAFHKKQIADMMEKSKEEKEEQLKMDAKNTELLVKEEETFQNYAEKVIDDAIKGKRNPFPLRKAAKEGPGGGRGPKFEGNAGLRPSYIVGDATGVQLPHYLKDESIHSRCYGHVGKSGRRLGFTW